MSGRSQLEISEFLDGLGNKKATSRGERAAVAKYIENHRSELESYIESKKERGSLGGIKLARHYSKLVEEYETSPEGLYYLEPEASLRTSFRMSRNVTALTFHTRTRSWRIIGYVITAAVVIATLWLGYQAKVYITDIIREGGDPVKLLMSDDLEGEPKDVPRNR